LATQFQNLLSQEGVVFALSIKSADYTDYLGHGGSDW
jgi:hypothetical protein